MDSKENIVATNRKAYYEYKVEETLIAGIILEGAEVKAFRDKKVDLAGTYAALEKDECIAYNIKVTFAKEEYELDANRPKKLLLKRSELNKLAAKYERKGCTLIPLQIFFAGPWAKVKLGVCIGKKQYDKKAAIKERTIEREARREK